jgi:hypothetical protein
MTKRNGSMSIRQLAVKVTRHNARFSSTHVYYSKSMLPAENLAFYHDKVIKSLYGNKEFVSILITCYKNSSQEQ